MAPGPRTEANFSSHCPIKPFLPTCHETDSVFQSCASLLFFFFGFGQIFLAVQKQKFVLKILLFYRTEDLVHKIVNARSSTFDAIEFIRGLQGGVGSGVREPG